MHTLTHTHTHAGCDGISAGAYKVLLQLVQQSAAASTNIAKGNVEALLSITKLPHQVVSQ